MGDSWYFEAATPYGRRDRIRLMETSKGYVYFLVRFALEKNSRSVEFSGLVVLAIKGLGLRLLSSAR